MMRYLLFRAVLPVAGRAHRLLYPVAGIVGHMLFRSGRLRRRLRRTYAPLCGGDDRRTNAAAAQALSHAVQYYVDLASLPYRDLTRLERDHLDVAHLERVAVLDRPGPRIIVGAHTAGTEIALHALLPRGYAFTGLVEAIEPARLSAFLARWRSRTGGRFVEADRAGLRDCLATLRKDGLVVLMGDRDIQGNGVCVEFFGRSVRFPRGPWDLALRTGAPVVPFLCAMQASGRIAVSIEEPIEVQGDRDDAVAGAARRWAALLEAHLASDPGQWIVTEDYWRVHRCGQG